MSDFTQGIVIIVCINMIAVLGVSVLTGFTRLFSFGNAGFMSIGAYASALLTVKLGIPFIPAILVGIVVAGFIAYLLGSLTLKLKGDYFLITTLGFGEMIRVLFNYLDITGGARGLAGIPKYTTIWFALGSLLLVIIITWTLIHSKFGRRFTAIREQEIAAESIGINITRTKKMAFVYSAMLAGFAGALFAHNLMFIDPKMFNLAKSAELTITVVIGGLGSLTGSIFGSLVVTLLPEFLRFLANFRMFLYGIAVVLIIILRPDGLFGYKEFSIKKTFFFVVRNFKRFIAFLKAKFGNKGGRA